MERVLPDDFLPMWARLGELRQKKEERSASRAAREEKQQAQKARQKKMEMKHLQNKNIVSISSDRIEELYRIVCSDRMSAIQQDAAACVPLDPRTVKQMKEIGCTDDHVHTAMLGLQLGGDLQDALDWLCMHVRDDELPLALRHKHGGSSVRVRLARGQPTTAGSAGLTSGPGALCLASMGYSIEDADAALRKCAGSTDALAGAWKTLFQLVAGCDLGDRAPRDADVLHWFGASAGHTPEEAVTEPQWLEPDDAGNPQAKAWWDEQFVVISVYPDQTVRASQWCVTVQLPLPPAMVVAYSSVSKAPASKQQFVELAMVVWQGCGYPHSLPLICVRCPVLPPGVLLHLTASVAAHLQQSCSGMEMLHEAYTHLEGLLQAEAPSAIVASLRWSSILPANDVEERSSSDAQAIAPEPKPLQKHGVARHRRPAAPPPGHHDRESKRLEQLMLDNQTTASGKKMLVTRQKLPAHRKRQDVLAAVAEHRVTVISGATGCGKSTQVGPIRPTFNAASMLISGHGALSFGSQHVARCKSPTCKHPPSLMACPFVPRFQDA